MTSSTPPNAASEIAILVFPDVELLDFAGPLEVFAVAHDVTNTPLFHVRTVAPVAGPFRAKHGPSIVPDVTIEAMDREIDSGAGAWPRVLVVPGGYGVRRILAAEFDERPGALPTIDFIRRAAEHAEIVLSVCTGAWLLAKAGLLAGKPATTHHLCFERLGELSPTSELRRDQRIVDCGRIITSGGISSGIDAALHVVARVHGDDRALAAAKYMEYAMHA